MSNLVKIVRKIVKSNIYMINDLFIDAKANVINFNCFVVLIINVHDHFNFNFLTSFFLFEIFSTTDERFKIEMLRRFSCWYWNVRIWCVLTRSFNKRERMRWTFSTLKRDCFVNRFQLINFLLQLFVDLLNFFKLVLRAR